MNYRRSQLCAATLWVAVVLGLAACSMRMRDMHATQFKPRAGNWTGLTSGAATHPQNIDNGFNPPVSGGGSSGTVTSVGLNGDGTVFQSSVAGSPVTVSGSFSPALVNQSANSVFAGPTTGSAAAPTFRSLVSGDLPAIPFSGLTGTPAYTQDGPLFQVNPTLSQAVRPYCMYYPSGISSTTFTATGWRASLGMAGTATSATASGQNYINYATGTTADTNVGIMSNVFEPSSETGQLNIFHTKIITDTTTSNEAYWIGFSNSGLGIISGGGLPTSAGFQQVGVWYSGTGDLQCVTMVNGTASDTVTDSTLVPVASKIYYISVVVVPGVSDTFYITPAGGATVVKTITTTLPTTDMEPMITCQNLTTTSANMGIYFMTDSWNE